MSGLFDFFRRRKPTQANRPNSGSGQARLTVERLEERSVPTSAGHTAPLGLDARHLAHHGGHHLAQDLPPYADGAPWARNYSRKFIRAEPPQLLQAMYFNNPHTYANFVNNFAGVLHAWVRQADQQGITQDAGLESFLGQNLRAFFPKVRPLLAHLYPGQTDQTYRLLMSMNLAHGYFNYAPTFGSGRSDAELLHLHTGDCTEIANLLNLLVRSQGIASQEVAQIYNFHTSVGQFVASHVAVYAGGLWLDSEINTAFALSMSQFRQIHPSARLEALLHGHHVFGFYNWYLKPQVRHHQLQQGEDGGIIAFYYLYYFQGIGSKHSTVDLVSES